MPSVKRRVLLMLVLVLGASGAAEAQAPQERLTAERMWRLARLGEPALSPDGRLAVVPVMRPDLAANDADVTLWRVPLAGGSAVVLASGAAALPEPTVSPDGKSVAFVAQFAGDEAPELYVVAMAGGEPRRVTSLPTGVRQPRWFPDSRRIAFVSDVWNDLVRWEDQRARVLARRNAPMTGQLWRRAVYAAADGSPEDREPELYSITLDGAEPVAITRMSGFSPARAEAATRSFDISPDGLEVALATDTGASAAGGRSDLLVLPACGCKPAHDLTADGTASVGAPRYSPDGRYLAFTSEPVGSPERQLVLYDRRTHARRVLGPEWARSVREAVWLANSSALLASAEDDGRRRLYRFELSGAAPRALTSSASYGTPASAAGATVALRESFVEPPTLVRIDAASGAATALTHFNDAQLEGVALGRAESVSYRGARGDAVQMWLGYPPDFDATRRYPVLLLLHDGPHAAVNDRMDWQWNLQVLAGWGYIVAAPNFHGSSGFGPAFEGAATEATAADGALGLAREDARLAAQWLGSRPFVDAHRMVAGGGGFGGRIAAALEREPHPFKAFIVESAVDDAHPQPGDSAASHAPTLVIEGARNPRIPALLGVEFFDALREREAASALLYFPDEGAAVHKPRNSLFWYQTVEAWLADSSVIAPP